MFIQAQQDGLQSHATGLKAWDLAYTCDTGLGARTSSWTPDLTCSARLCNAGDDLKRPYNQVAYILEKIVQYT